MVGQGGRDRLDWETLTAEIQAGYQKERGGVRGKKASIHLSIHQSGDAA